jgi:acylphosphatase
MGRVQGVGFRWFVREAARRRLLSGWVRNRPDGSVEIAAEGEGDALAAFVAAVRVGPAGAAVAEARELPGEDIGAMPKPFAILK